MDLPPTDRQVATEGPVTVAVELHLDAGRVDAALDQVLAVIAAWRAEPGCEGITVLRNPDDATHLLLLETFSSADALRRHEGLPATQEAVGRMLPYLAGPPGRTDWAVVGSR